MKYKELKKWLDASGVRENDEILLGSDEELNTLYKDLEFARFNYEGEKKREFVLYGLSGSEVEENSIHLYPIED